MKPHIHCELIKLWAGGSDIEQSYKSQDKWVDIDPNPYWDSPYLKFRVKPKTLKYRLWIGGGREKGKFMGTVFSESSESQVEKSIFFLKWHGDWQEVEV